MFGVYFTVFSSGITSLLFSKLLTVTNDKFDIFHKYIDKDYFLKEQIKFIKYFNLIGLIAIISSVCSIFIEFFAFKLADLPMYDYIGILSLTMSIICFISLFLISFYFTFKIIIKSILSKIYKVLLYTTCILSIYIVFINNPFGVSPLYMIELLLIIYF